MYLNMITHIGKYLMKDGQICDVVSHKDRVLGVIFDETNEQIRFCQSLISTVFKVIASRKSSILLKRMIRNMAIGICIGAFLL